MTQHLEEIKKMETRKWLQQLFYDVHLKRMLPIEAIEEIESKLQQSDNKVSPDADKGEGEWREERPKWKCDLALLMGKLVGPRDASFDQPLEDFIQQLLSSSVSKAIEEQEKKLRKIFEKQSDANFQMYEKLKEMAVEEALDKRNKEVEEAIEELSFANYDDGHYVVYSDELKQKLFSHLTPIKSLKKKI